MLYYILFQLFLFETIHNKKLGEIKSPFLPTLPHQFILNLKHELQAQRQSHLFPLSRGSWARELWLHELLRCGKQVKPRTTCLENFQNRPSGLPYSCSQVVVKYPNMEFKVNRDRSHCPVLAQSEIEKQVELSIWTCWAL